MSSLKFPAVIVLGVVAVLLSAGAVFGLRSWVGTEKGDGDLGTSPTASPSPTDEASAEASAPPTSSPTKSAKPTPSKTPTPTPTPTKKPTPEPTKKPAPTSLSTSYIEKVISQRLATTTGEPVSVGCPGSVSAKVGTSFGCSVRIQSSPSKATTASVVIVSSDGRFKWSSGSAQ
ncbi:hypothetical protein ASD11_05880 [Aeromicrobium sp. Root495]|uniref:DUF4333 domain-containing protein n=1 Tax=Aeromicrobium sp. Root495 TaxID=1736550 RepID=UPI0007013129|nr:DUF4333 domain-containing protein [Aeromicrobium sp. Root495]KQY59124.1 hypothetical protein ASD11_05880 [Aeromicrobium sp. Root495]